MKLESFIEIVEDLVHLYDEDTAFAIFDREQLLAHSFAPKLDFKHYIGRPMPKGGTAEEAIRTGRRIVRPVSKDVMGIPYMGVAYPIREKDGSIVGVVAVAISIEKYDKLMGFGQNILDSARKISANAESVSAAAEELAATVRNMNDETVSVMTNVDRTNSIAGSINKISAQSNILGINASIEAARAGEMGRGFSVVAYEIRKLAENTNTSTREVNTILGNVQSSVNSLTESLKQLANLSESQAYATIELSESISTISAMAESLIALAVNKEHSND